MQGSQGNRIPYGHMSRDNIPIIDTVRLGGLWICFTIAYLPETVEYCRSWICECTDRETLGIIIY